MITNYIYFSMDSPWPWPPNKTIIGICPEVYYDYRCSQITTSLPRVNSFHKSRKDMEWEGIKWNGNKWNFSYRSGKKWEEIERNEMEQEGRDFIVFIIY